MAKVNHDRLVQGKVKEYAGPIIKRPDSLPFGDYYFAEDTNTLYKYNYQREPIEIGGGGSADNTIYTTNGSISGESREVSLLDGSDLGYSLEFVAIGSGSKESSVELFNDEVLLQSNLSGQITLESFDTVSNTNFTSSAGVQITDTEAKLVHEIGDGVGAVISEASINASNGLIITNTITNAGAEYDQDYSVGYTDRSLVDKAYADSIAQASSNYDGKVNEAGGILKGQLVYISGATGGFPQVSLADNSDFSKGDVLAFATETKSDNQTIRLQTAGLLTNIDTSSFTEGAIIYLGLNGNITDIHPLGINAVQRVGHAVKINASSGDILIELDQLTIINDHNDTMRHQIVNQNAGTFASAAYTLVNDANHRASVTLTSSNTFGTGQTLLGLYNEGYGRTIFTVDGNHGFEWNTDETDSHDFSSTKKMGLTPAGDLSIVGGLNSLGLLEYLDNAAALAGGLVVGDFYRNGGSTRVVHSGDGVVDTLAHQIICNQDNKDTTLGGVIDSTKEYFIDGIIDMGTTQITVPSSGIEIKGYSFDNSGLISTEDNYTMFVSETAIIGSGNVLCVDIYITTSGTNSKVYELYDSNGFHAIEMNRVNYNDCTSLGDLHEYRQGLELGTGRFGGSPSLILHGTWIGGFRISTSITRGMSDTTTTPLFCAGTAFVMNSRFLTDMNVDLGTLQPFTDFAPANFSHPSSLEFVDMLLTRDGVIDAEDANITPNISESDLESAWKGNHGIHNTFVGAASDVTVEVQTTISTQNVSVPLLGTQVASDLAHFDSPANGQLRFLGTAPIAYSISWDFVIDGSSNKEYTIELIRERLGTPTIVYSQTRVINNLQGGRDVAYFTGTHHERILQNDITYWKIKNITGTQNCTIELGSDWTIDHR